MGIDLTPGLRQLLAFGTGAGIQIAASDLEVAVARVRPNGIQVLGRIAIPRFRERPAAQWGAEYSALLSRLGMPHLSATVLLPRPEVIVRQLVLRGVESKDLEAAITFQLDGINPYGDQEVLFGWQRLSEGGVLVGMVRRETVDRYLELFTAAGIATASFTFTAAAIHGAIRLAAPPPREFMACSDGPGTAVEVYGESPSRPVFSAVFDAPAARAAALAAAELRLPPDTVPTRLESLLPAPRVNPVENDLARNALPYAAALSSACPRLAPAANLLPPERRASASRGIFIPTAVAAALLLIVLGATLAWPGYDRSRYLKELDAQIAAVRPQATRAVNLERQIRHTRDNARLLEEFRARTRADLDAIVELSRLLPPPAWASTVDLTRDAVVITGEADQAAPLLKLLDASPLFHNSEFNGISKSQNIESFRLRSLRRPRP
ncbi:MAG TPA: PilN domain-containing protein [Bryobacteraceae bacterium]|nr:PilN domain-containing protein [Bryobacteraceae bacterium]